MEEYKKGRVAEVSEVSEVSEVEEGKKVEIQSELKRRCAESSR